MTDIESLEIRVNGVHNHDNGPYVAERDVIRDTLKRKAVECPSEKPLKLIMREVMNNQISFKVSGKDLDNFSKAIRRVRLNRHGANPKDIKDTVGKLIEIKDNESFQESNLILLN